MAAAEDLPLREAAPAASEERADDAGSHGSKSAWEEDATAGAAARGGPEGEEPMVSPRLSRVHPAPPRGDLAASAGEGAAVPQNINIEQVGAPGAEEPLETDNESSVKNDGGKVAPAPGAEEKKGESVSVSPRSPRTPRTPRTPNSFGKRISVAFGFGGPADEELDEGVEVKRPKGNKRSMLKRISTFVTGGAVEEEEEEEEEDEDDTVTGTMTLEERFAAKKEADKLRKQKERLELLVKDHRAELTPKKSRMVELEKDLTNVKTRLNAVEKLYSAEIEAFEEIKSGDARQKQLESWLNDLSAEHEKVETTFTDLAQEVKAAETHIVSLEDQMRRKDMRIRALKSGTKDQNLISNWRQMIGKEQDMLKISRAMPRNVMLLLASRITDEKAKEMLRPDRFDKETFELERRRKGNGKFVSLESDVYSVLAWTATVNRKDAFNRYEVLKARVDALEKRRSVAYGEMKRVKSMKNFLNKKKVMMLIRRYKQELTELDVDIKDTSSAVGKIEEMRARKKKTGWKFLKRTLAVRGKIDEERGKEKEVMEEEPSEAEVLSAVANFQMGGMGGMGGMGDMGGMGGMGRGFMNGGAEQFEEYKQMMAAQEAMRKQAEKEKREKEEQERQVKEAHQRRQAKEDEEADLSLMRPNDFDFDVEMGHGRHTMSRFGGAFGEDIFDRPKDEPYWRMAKLLKNTQHYALKVLPYNYNSAIQKFRRVVWEAESKMYELIADIPFCVHNRKSIDDATHGLYLVCDLVRGGDLARYFARSRVVNEHQAPVKTTAFYSACLAIAMSMCHKRGVMLRECLSPLNIFLNDRGYPRMTKVAQNARVVNKKFLKGEGKNSWGGYIGQDYHGIANLVPDILIEQSAGEEERVGYTAEGDYWMLGAFMYEALTGRMPFNDALSRYDGQMAKPEVIYESWKEAALDAPERACAFLIEDKVPQSVQRLVFRLLHPDPSKRLTDADALLRDPFFEHLDIPLLALERLEAPIRPAFVDGKDGGNNGDIDVANLAKLDFA